MTSSNTPQSRPLLSVVIPALNEEVSIVRTLDHLVVQDAIDEIIVVDNGNTPRSSSSRRQPRVSRSPRSRIRQGSRRFHRPHRRRHPGRARLGLENRVLDPGPPRRVGRPGRQPTGARLQAISRL
ncbi:glycosyltransferase [Nocardia sp. NPDC101769]|uniref:glycosyltransferase n=1 Tax=Nocardia sp. NPDC101769 TaxID=3364333 RepID=UPI0038027AFB